MYLLQDILGLKVVCIVGTWGQKLQRTASSLTRKKLYTAWFSLFGSISIYQLRWLPCFASWNKMHQVNFNRPSKIQLTKDYHVLENTNETPAYGYKFTLHCKCFWSARVPAEWSSNAPWLLLFLLTLTYLWRKCLNLRWPRRTFEYLTVCKLKLHCKEALIETLKIASLLNLVQQLVGIVDVDSRCSMPPCLCSIQYPAESLTLLLHCSPTQRRHWSLQNHVTDQFIDLQATQDSTIPLFSREIRMTQNTEMFAISLCYKQSVQVTINT